MDNKKELILVTGGTGYIGAHTVVELQQSGYQVLIIDNLSNSTVQIIDQVTKITGQRPGFIELDLRDRQQVLNVIEQHPAISGIIHFAASKSVSESVEDPLLYYDNNICSLINLLQAIKGKAVKFVFSSSCTVYGEPDQLPVTEATPIKAATSPYGNTKQMGEAILKDTALASELLKVIALRYFNPVGAHASALIGELPKGVPQNLVPFVTQTAIGKRKQLVVYGDDYPTPDGSCIRDYIHVVDLAKAHVAAIQRMERNQMEAAYEIFNIGTGTGNSVLELINVFEQVTGVKLNYRIGPKREGDIIKIWADVSKATDELKWTAKLNLNDMLASAWAWEKYIDNKPFEND